MFCSQISMEFNELEINLLIPQLKLMRNDVICKRQFVCGKSFVLFGNRSFVEFNLAAAFTGNKTP